jgi:hypothetical protein
MPNQIKAIETRWKGYHFRSRLEARWAVFFEALGLNWEYEPEGFVLKDGTNYLPDFKVTSPNGAISWYEVKNKTVKSDPKMKTFDQTLAMENLHGETLGGFQWSTTSVTLLSGDPLDVLESRYVCPRCGTLANEIDEHARYKTETYLTCNPCDVDTPFGGDQDIEKGMFARVRPHKGCLVIANADWDRVLHRVQKAAERAREARFEHGANTHV